MGVTAYDPPSSLSGLASSSAVSGSGSVTVQGKRITSGTHAVDVSGANQILITGNEFDGTSAGIRLTGVVDGASITIEKNRLLNMSSRSIEIEGTGGTNVNAYPSVTLTIRGNWMQNAAGIYLAQMRARQNKPWVISHNLYYNGVWISQAEGLLQMNYVVGWDGMRCIFVRNNVSDQPSSWDGTHGSEDHINLSETSGVEIKWNKIFGGVGSGGSTSGGGILLGDIEQEMSHTRGGNCLMRENIVVRPHVGGYGIAMTGGVANEISRNVVIDDGAGIYVGVKVADYYVAAGGSGMAPITARDNWINGAGVAQLNTHSGGGTTIAESLINGWASNVGNASVIRSSLGIGADLRDWSLDSSFFDSLGMPGGFGGGGGGSTGGTGGSTGGGSGGSTGGGTGGGSGFPDTPTINTTAGLNVIKVEQSQSQKEVTINEAFDVFDLAIAGFVDVAMNNATHTLTPSESVAAMLDVVGALTADQTLLFPPLTKSWIVRNSTTGGFSINLNLISGVSGDEIELAPGDSILVFSDGVSLLSPSVQDLTAGPYDIGVPIYGTLTDAETVMLYVAPRALHFPAGLAGSQGYAQSPASATADLTLTVNGVTKATIRFAASSNTATFIAATAFDVAIGDRMQITGPATADASLSDVTITLKGTR